MLYRCSITAIALAALCLTCASAQAQDAAKTAAAKTDASQYDPSRYPDWSGPMRWTTTRGGNRYDQYKPAGRGQEAPLTPGYQAAFEAGLKDQAEVHRRVTGHGKRQARLVSVRPFNRGNQKRRSIQDRGQRSDP